MQVTTNLPASISEENLTLDLRAVYTEYEDGMVVAHIKGASRKFSERGRTAREARAKLHNKILSSFIRDV